MNMLELLAEIRKVVPFKDTTAPGDILLVMGENPQMIVYALVDTIEADTSRRDKWWHVTMKFLSVPPRETVWTLREEQFTGREVFTMGGDKRFVQAVDLARLGLPEPDEDSQENPSPFRRVK